MEKRKWLWKRKSSDRSSGETESSGSISSPSERYSDEQDILKESPNIDTLSPEITSKATVTDDEIKDSVRSLTEKLSAALVNVSAKEDLVKQHAKVAEEAVAGWEKAENEVATVKQQLEATIQQNVALEVRVNHLDGALKECVRQLRQAKEEQERNINDATVATTSEWESIKAELENKILELQAHIDADETRSPSAVDPDLYLKLGSLEKENSILKAELISLSEELEIRTIERDLSTQAAETASKQQLESIKKVAKLEAECRKLQALVRRSSTINDQKSVAASSTYVGSLTDSQSDSREQVNAVDIGAWKMSKSDQYDREPSCSDSWASALIAELDQFKNEKAMTRNLATSSVKIDMMDDFLEMERLAAFHDTKTEIASADSCSLGDESTDEENNLKAELETMTKRVAELEERLMKLEAEKAKLENSTSQVADFAENTLKAELETMTRRVAELEEKLMKLEAEKAELENSTSHVADLQKKLVKIEEEKAELENMINRLADFEKMLVKIEEEKAELIDALDKSQDSLKASQAQLGEAEIRLEELQKDLALTNESKELLEFQLIGMEVEARTVAANIESLKAEVEKEQNLSAEMKAKCLELENELTSKYHEVELQQVSGCNGDVKVKQEDLSVAADKLAECQKTIASLGMQLQSLATLEDFLIDTTNLPGFSTGTALVPRTRAHAEPWKLHSNGTFLPRHDSDRSVTPGEIASNSLNANEGESPASSSSSISSTNNTSSSKGRNSFGKLFSRSKNGAQLENESSRINEGKLGN